MSAALPAPLPIPLPAPLLFESGERRLATLDGLARSLWLGGLTNSQGSLEPRLDALAGLRRELLAGATTAPDTWPWPPLPIARALNEAIGRLDLASYCSDKEELTDTVLMSILFHLDFIVDYRDRGASEAEALGMAIEAFENDWQQHCGEIDELVQVFGMVPDDCKHSRWDQMRGLLHSSGWQEVLRIRRLLERLPELGKIIRELGRSRPSEEPDTASQAIVEVMDKAIAQRPETRTVRVPDMPGETRGIHRSDRIARMLPAEAMLLGHPRLRLVWHARRAERTLLSYEDDDRMTEVRLHQALVSQPRPGPQAGKRLELGPMLVCVDTSGSMQGGAEAVAKAIVLEAMRAAHAQQRACHVFAFGGPDELVEMELGVDRAGIERVTDFLGQAFRGGTDICGPLESVIAKLEDQRWQLADLLIATDGEFGATPAVAARLAAVKRELGLRVQGVLIADRETVGLLEVADSIYPVRDWRRYGGSNVDSPIPSERLTAMFFPGALRNAANRQATVAGEAISSAVRASWHLSEPAQESQDSGENEAGTKRT
ncbi:MAG: VWA domain-containing protein [Rhodocyclales bacterium]|nr:VWA domain-containing protein [Rhodocyclales bacterium]